MSAAPHLTQQILQRILFYDPLTGLFVWRVRDDVRPQWNGRYAGKRAGYEWTASGGGRYRSIRIFDYPFPEHRLAWLYVAGSWPVGVVDHRDMIGTNNAWGNLREASRAQNSANSRAWKNNKVGLKGVCRQGSRFRATISVNGRHVALGVFDTASEAHEAYRQAALKRSGEFARAS